MKSALETRGGDMDKAKVIAHLESLLSAYNAGGIAQDGLNHKYRLIWVSETDAEALEDVIGGLKNGNDD